MKPTSNTVLINGEQGVPDQRRCQWGWGVGEGKRRVRQLLIVPPVFTLWGREDKGRVRPTGSTLNPVPLWEQQPSPLPIGHTEYLIDIHNHLLLLTLNSTHPPPFKQTLQHIQTWLKFKNQCQRHRHGQQWTVEGLVGCGSLGSYKRQMRNHLTAPKLVAWESAGMLGGSQSMNRQHNTKTIFLNYNMSFEIGLWSSLCPLANLTISMYNIVSFTSKLYFV